LVATLLCPTKVTMFLSILSASLLISVKAQDCSVFQEGSCPLDENNIVGLNSMVDNAGACQTLCKYMYPNQECQFFTHFGEECYQLASCTYVEPCPGCVSGPLEPNFDSCPWPPVSTTTSGPDTTTTPGEDTTVTTTMAVPTTTEPATETEAPTTMPTEPTRPACEVNSGSLCAQGGNLIEHIEHIHDVSDCQAICQNHASCEYWSHYLEEGGEHWGHCWLHYACDSFEEHAECFGEGDRECTMTPPFREPRPGPGGKKCYCQNGANSPDLDECGELPPTPIPCIEEFYPGVLCDEEELLEIQGIPTASDCQAVCQNHAGCEYFSQWFEEGPEHQGWCYLFSSCAVWDASECNELVDQCFSGPAYPDMDDCSGP